MSRLPNNRFAIAIPTYNRARSLSAVLRDALPVCADLNVKVYVTDNTHVTSATGWRPTRTPRTILADLHAWMVEYGHALGAVLNP